jgi:pimeloyl-ACP methyl ester carboxylesterase
MFAVSARLVGCLLTASVFAGGCSAPPRIDRSAAASAQAPQLSGWGPCPSDDAPGVECATISVPYDYARPGGERFTIPVTRIPSKADKPQLLIMNPGGPGISGVDDLRSGREHYEKFTDVYTVVSFDPRGVGGSTPAVSCLDDQQKAAIFNQPSMPRSEADTERRRELATGIGVACERQFGSVLSYLGTENVVRDMDAIRAAMGFDKTSFLGYSYGTFVGALYVQMFPERTGRVVLDSVMSPELDYRAVRHEQATGMQASITAFAEDCLRRSDCPLLGPAANAVQTIVGIIDRLDAMSYRAPDGRELSGSRMLALVESSQYMPASGWPALRATLRDALADRWPAVVEAAYSPDLMVNPADSEYLSVVCTDFATERDPAAAGRLAPIWAQESPLSGGNRAWSLAPCESWPVGPVRKPGPVNPEGAGPVLILNTTGDPATPLAWAQSLHRQIRGSSLVIAPGPGHLASSQNTCAEKILVAFLLDGTPPPQPISTCPVNS